MKSIYKGAAVVGILIAAFGDWIPRVEDTNRRLGDMLVILFGFVMFFGYKILAKLEDKDE